MRRVAVGILTGFSTLAFVAVAALWVWAERRHGELTNCTAGDRWASLGTSRTGLHLTWAPAASADFDDGRDDYGDTVLVVTVLRWSSPRVAWGQIPRGRRAIVPDGPLELWVGPERLHAGFGYDVDRHQDPPTLVLLSGVDPSQPSPPDPPPRSWWVHRVAVPFWFLLAVTGAMPVARLGITIRRRRRRPGRCHHCGYDLRATPQRCPECGTTPIAERPI